MTVKYVEKPQKGKYAQVFATVIGNLMAISDGMSVGWTAPMIPYLLSDKSHIKTTKHETEWLETWYQIGGLVGLPITIFFVGKFGRKKSLLGASSLLLLGWIWTAVANKIEYLYATRFLAGLGGDIAFVAAPMYIAEIANEKIRGFLSSIIFLMMKFGILIMYVTGPFLPHYVPAIIASVLLTTELVVFSFLPETPYFLLLTHKPQEAEASLQKYRSTKDVKKELEEISNAVERQRLDKPRILDIIFVKSNRKAMTIMAVLNIAQQLSCVNIILMNLHIILEEADSVYIEPSYAGIVFSTLLFVACALGSLLIDKFGRKKLLVTSSILTGMCLFSLATYLYLKTTGYEVKVISWIPVVSVMVYAAVFKFGLGMVPIVITAEIFATQVKAVGMTLADFFYVMGGIIGLQVFQILSHTHGMYLPFFVFSCCSFASALFVVFFIPETNGKTLDEIQRILEGDKKPSKCCPVN